MPQPRIVAIVLVKNEDIFIDNVLKNIVDFCDEIIVTDNYSTDMTHDIVMKMAEKHPKIRVMRINHPRDSHKVIEHFAGTNTWVFGVDGDEIYDPAGLREMRDRLITGDYDNVWSIKGNVLNCSTIDRESQKAKGYLSPPCRSMTKLYNFSLLESWTGCPERLHSGTRVYRNPDISPVTKNIFDESEWEGSCFRCLHAVFISRSTGEKGTLKRSRLNPAEIEAIASAKKKKSHVKLVKRLIQSVLGSNWKYRKYRRGPLVEKNIGGFLH